MAWRILYTLVLIHVTASEESHWVNRVFDGESATVACNNSQVNFTGSGNVEWTTPTGTTLKSNHDDTEYKVVQHDNYDGLLLTVKNVKKGNSGVYACKIMQNGMADQNVIRGINVGGPKYRTFMDQYEYNIIVAVVASVVFLVPFMTACAVWRFRWRDDEKGLLHDNGRDNGNVMVEIPQKIPPSDLEAAEGHGAYDNLASDTKL